MADLNDIALFVQVVRSGSFAEAARHLGLPSNTVSSRVQELEQQLSTRLLQRSTRKLTLTSLGQSFYERCVDAVDGLVEAEEELTTGSQEPSGLVRVAAPADFFNFFPMEHIAKFLTTYPRVRLEFMLSDAKADLIADRIDVALRGGQLQDSGYISRPILESRSDGLVASPTYLALRGAPKTLQDLNSHDCVCFAHPSGHTIWRLTGPGGLYEEVQVTARLSGNTVEALRKATVAGLGIALLPYAIAMHDLQSGQLVPVLDHYQRKGQGLNVLYASRRHLPLAVSAFVELVIAQLNSLRGQELEHKSNPAQ